MIRLRILCRLVQIDVRRHGLPSSADIGLSIKKCESKEPRSVMSRKSKDLGIILCARANMLLHVALALLEYSTVHCTSIKIRIDMHFTLFCLGRCYAGTFGVWYAVSSSTKLCLLA